MTLRRVSGQKRLVAILFTVIVYKSIWDKLLNYLVVVWDALHASYL